MNIAQGGHVTHKATIMLNQSVLSGDDTGGAVEVIQSRFGQVSIDTGKAINFTRGLLGMPDRFRFALASFPSPKMKQFALMQSLEDAALSFITLPINIDNPIIAAQDIRNACRDLQIAEANLAMLLVVSVHRNMDSVKLSVNARAPIMIDSERRLGTQYVFSNDLYKVQHMLGENN